MRIAIVDDEKVFREKFQKSIDCFYRNPDIICSLFSDGDELLNEYRKGKTFDAVFLDIEMPKMDGMKTAKILRKYSDSVPIIFITSHTEFAMDGYEVEAFRFLSKNCSEDKLKTTLDDLLEKLSERKRLILKCGCEENIVSAERIVLAESENNLVRFVTEETEYHARMKLTYALELLNEAIPFFVRVHRCSIVNLSHVLKYNDKNVYMDNGDVIPISKSFSEIFRKRMFEYVRKSAK